MNFPTESPTRLKQKIFRKLKHANPLHLDDVAVDFPDLTIIQAHGGRGFWYDTAFFLARLHRNVYINISGLPPKNLLKYFPELAKIADNFFWLGLAGCSNRSGEYRSYKEVTAEGGNQTQDIGRKRQENFGALASPHFS